MDSRATMRPWQKALTVLIVITLFALIGYTIYDHLTHDVTHSTTLHSSDNNDGARDSFPVQIDARLMPSLNADATDQSSATDQSKQQTQKQQQQQQVNNSQQQDDILRAQFNEWIVMHNKQYPNDSERGVRYLNWLDNKRFIDEFNARANAGGTTSALYRRRSPNSGSSSSSNSNWTPRYRLALNQFADLTHTEMNDSILGPRQVRSKAPLEPPPSDKSIASVDTPLVIDWRRARADQSSPSLASSMESGPSSTGDSFGDKCYVDERVYDQGSCTVGHIYATLSTLEAFARIKSARGADTCAALAATPVIGHSTINARSTHKEFNSTIDELSRRQLIDCLPVTTPGGAACSSSGQMLDVYRYAARHGILSSSTYAEIGKCPASSSSSSSSSSVMKIVGPGVVNRDDLVDVLAAHPLTVAIDASRRTFHFYAGGVYNDRECSTTQYNHHMMLIGYDHHQRVWTLKNSLGLAWGERGFMRLTRDLCGIESDVAYPKM